MISFNTPSPNIKAVILLYYSRESGRCLDNYQQRIILWASSKFVFLQGGSITIQGGSITINYKKCFIPALSVLCFLGLHVLPPLCFHLFFPSLTLFFLFYYRSFSSTNLALASPSFSSSGHSFSMFPSTPLC